MTAVSKNVYFDVLDNTVNKYDNTVHRSTKMKPIGVMKKITNFSTNPFISGQLFKATAFMVTPKLINTLTFCF